MSCLLRSRLLRGAGDAGRTRGDAAWHSTANATSVLLGKLQAEVRTPPGRCQAGRARAVGLQSKGVSVKSAQ